jgi:hypothetical protein
MSQKRSTQSTEISEVARFIKIEECLLWKGGVRRKDLIDEFGINPVLVAQVFTKYKALNPTGIEYDKSRKKYVVTPEFKPVFLLGATLDSLAATGVPDIPLERPALDRPAVSQELVVAVISAIRFTRRLFIKYQGISQPGSELTEREIVPIAFVHDGSRWHIRAYCLLRLDFRDFVISRVQSFEDRGRYDSVIPEDSEWTSLRRVRLEAPHDRPECQRAVLSKELGLPRDVVVRKALLRYLKHQARGVNCDQNLFAVIE